MSPASATVLMISMMAFDGMFLTGYHPPFSPDPIPAWVILMLHEFVLLMVVLPALLPIKRPG